MKKLVFIAVILIATACSTTKTVTNDAVDKSKTVVIPDGKAIVYFVRPSTKGGVANFVISCNDSLIGGTYGKQYVFTILDPGTYKFISKAGNKAEIELKVEADKKYYIEQVYKWGLILAENNLILLSEAEGKQKLSKCSLSKKMPNSKINKFMILF